MNRSSTSMLDCVTQRMSLHSASMLALALSAPACYAAAANLVQIELQARGEVAGAVVTLSDIAQLTGGDASTKRRLSEMVVGPAPKAGETTQLSRQRIHTWLSANRQLASLDWQLAGAAAVEIQRASQWIDGERLSVTARQSLEAWLRARTSRFKLAITQPVRPLAVPAGELVFTPREPAQAVRPTKRMQVWVDIWANGRFVRTEAVGFEVQAFQSVWIAPVKLSTGHVLQEANIDSREVDLTTLGITPWFGSPAGLALRRAILPGQVLATTDLEAPPAVERGSTVTVRSRVGAITVITTAQALQAGHRGQRIRVKSAESSQSVAAMVVEPHVVEVSQ